MANPRVTFTNAIKNSTISRPNLKNTALIIGEFSRGPGNIPREITSTTDFNYTYGSDISPGSLNYQVVYNQITEPNRRNLACYRVLGSGQLASGAVIFNGIATKDNTLLFNIKRISQPVSTEEADLDISQVVITSSGLYTGTVTGRYHFKVTALTPGTNSLIATIKYVFLPIENSNNVIVNYTETINWSTVIDSFQIELDSDATTGFNPGTPQLIDDGVSISIGSPSQTDNINLKLGAGWVVRVESYTSQTVINEGDTDNQITNNFISSIIGKLPIGDVEANSMGDGAVFYIDPTYEGEIGNTFKYYFELLDSVSPGITVTNTGVLNSQSFSGGVNSPRIAETTFYTATGIPLLKLLANSEGNYGNQIRVSISPLAGARFRLDIVDLDANRYNPRLDPESYILDFKSLDANGVLQQLNSSKFINGVFLPKYVNPNNFDINLVNSLPLRLAPIDLNETDVDSIYHEDYFGADKLKNIPLRNGYDGPTLTEQDYIKALDNVDNITANFLLIANYQGSRALESALAAHCESSIEYSERRKIGFLPCKPGLRPNEAQSESIGLESPYIVKTAGWITYSSRPDAGNFSVSAAAINVGKKVNSLFFIGAHSPDAGAALGVANCDTFGYSDSRSLALYEQARLDVLAYNYNTNNYKLVNGRNLSSNSRTELVTSIGAFNYIREDVSSIVKSYLSSPNTIGTRRTILRAISQYLSQLVTRGWIYSYTEPTELDINDAQNYLSREMNIAFGLQEVQSLDFINITMYADDLNGNVSFNSFY